MKIMMICTFLALQVSQIIGSNDETFMEQVESRQTWPSFTGDSYIYLLGLFNKQRTILVRQSFTMAQPAMFRAAVILSQRLNIIANGKQFAYRVEDTTGRDEVQTLDCTCSAISENQILGVVGPEYSSDTKTVSRLANHVGLPVMGHSATDPELSNRHAYHTFYRLPPSDLTTARALSKLFQKYSWNSTNIIYQSDEYGEGGLKALIEVFNQRISISRQIKYDLLTKEIDNLQSQLENSPSRIVIVWANANVTAQILAKAIEAGNILAPAFLWILMTSPPRILTDEDVKQLAGMFILRLVTPKMFGVSVNTTLLDQAKDIWKEYQPETYPDDEKNIDIHSLYAFDAAWTLILAIDKLCQQNPQDCLSYKTSSSCFRSELVYSKELNQIIQTMNFTGVSGHIQFQSDTTDRVGNITAHYIIENLQPSKNDSDVLEAVEVLRLNGILTDMKRSNDPKWEKSDETILWPSHSSEAPKSYSRLGADVTLNITVYVSPPFFMLKPDVNNISRPYGYIHDLIESLQKRMRFKYTYTIAPSQYSYHDLVELVRNHTYQFLAADLTITSNRSAKIDFSYPIYDNIIRLVIRKGERTEFSPFGFLKPFSCGLWLLIIFVVYIGSALLITCYEYCKPQGNLPRQPPTETDENQMNNDIAAWERGFTLKPTTSYGHLQLIIVRLLGIILTALLTGNLIIHFKSNYEKPWLQSIEDLRMCHKVACNRIGIIGGSQHEEYFKAEVMNGFAMNYHRLQHTYECYTKLLDHHIDVAIADSSSADYFTQTPSYCRLETTGIPFGKTYFGIAIPKDWPYKQDLDDNIMCLKLTDELDRLLEKWFQQKHCDKENENEDDGENGSIQIPETSGLFIIFGSLMGLILVVFVVISLCKQYRRIPATPNMLISAEKYKEDVIHEV